MPLCPNQIAIVWPETPQSGTVQSYYMIEVSVPPNWNSFSSIFFFPQNSCFLPTRWSWWASGEKAETHKQPQQRTYEPHQRAHVTAASRSHALPPFEVFQLLMGLDPIQGEAVARLSISWLTRCADSTVLPRPFVLSSDRSPSLRVMYRVQHVRKTQMAFLIFRFLKYYNWT